MRKVHRIGQLTMLLVFLATLATACGSAKPSIVGEWEGVYDGNTITITFDDRGTVTMTVDRETQEATYAVDMSTKPAQLDIELAGEKIETIIEFVGADTLRIENAYPGTPRPTSFIDYIEMTRP